MTPTELTCTAEAFAALVMAAKEAIVSGVTLSLAEFGAMLPESRLAWQTALHMVRAEAAVTDLNKLTAPRLEAAMRAAPLVGDDVILNEVEAMSKSDE